jgi:hypothetical protein
MFPPGWLSDAIDAAGDGIAHVDKDNWDRPRLPLEGSGRWGPARQDYVGLQANQFFRERSRPIGVSAGRTNIHPQVAGQSGNCG